MSVSGIMYLYVSKKKKKLTGLFLVAIITLPPWLFMLSSRQCIDASMQSWTLGGPLSSILDAHSRSMSSVACKDLSVVMSSLIPWSICWSSSLVYFKNGSENLTRGTAQVFIHLRFLLCCLLSSCFLFLFLHRYLKFFFFISVCLVVFAFSIPKYLYVSFSQSVLIFSWVGSSIPFVICRFPLFIMGIL